MNDLNKLSQDIHKIQVDKGFFDKPRETGTLLMLITSELAECLESDRKNKHSILDNINNEDFIKSFEENVKDTFEDELADVFIRLFDFIGYYNVDIEKHVELKMKYNLTRPYKNGKNY